jgi:hypothetical protein
LLQQTLIGHNYWVTSVVFSHDSKLLASGSSDKTVKVWDAATGSLQQTLKGHGSSVRSVAFSHDSKLLASGSGDGTIKVWDVATGSLQQTIAIYDSFTSLSFDVSDSTLVTNMGRIRVDRTGLPALSKSYQEARGKSDYQGLGISESWITWNAQNFLWLPPDYRDSRSDLSLSGSRVALGCRSGKVSVIGFSLAILLELLNS